jgi:hypothetical protein
MKYQLQGKGMFLWNIPRAENGDTTKIISVAREANFSHLLVKIADGPSAYTKNSPYLSDLFVQAKDAGIRILGWHYLYGYDWEAEANRSITELEKYSYDGFVMNAEGQYKSRYTSAEKYSARVREAFPDMLLGLSSYRYPSYHPKFPFNQFLENVDLNLPQVYWVYGDGTVPYQIERTLREFSNKDKFVQRPIFPTGAAYIEHGWSAKPADVAEFLRLSYEKGFRGCNFWEWYYPRTSLFRVWEIIRDFNKPGWEPDYAEKREPIFRVEVINASKLNIRSTPKYVAEGTNILGQLSLGEREDVYDKADVWYKIKTGWIHSDYTKIVKYYDESEPEPEPEPELTLEEKVNILWDEYKKNKSD